MLRDNITSQGWWTAAFVKKPVGGKLHLGNGEDYASGLTLGVERGNGLAGNDGKLNRASGPASDPAR
jgi:hypothetical protein